MGRPTSNVDADTNVSMGRLTSNFDTIPLECPASNVNTELDVPMGHPTSNVNNMTSTIGIPSFLY